MQRDLLMEQHELLREQMRQVLEDHRAVQAQVRLQTQNVTEATARFRRLLATTRPP